MILGIDVGLTGAVAFLQEDGSVVAVHDLPTMPNGKKSAKVKQQVNAGALARLFLGGNVECQMVFIEQQAAMPKQGVSSMFSLGHSLGTIQGVLAALQIPFIMVQPQEWKQHWCINGADKNFTRTFASRRFPTVELSLKKHHNRAEALLIAAYGVARSQRRTDVTDDIDEVGERGDAARAANGVAGRVGADARG